MQATVYQNNESLTLKYVAYDKMYWPTLKKNTLYGKIIFFSRCFQL